MTVIGHCCLPNGDDCDTFEHEKRGALSRASPREDSDLGMQAKNWCSVFEAIDACSTFDRLAALSVTTVSTALRCSGGSVQEVSYVGSGSRLGRHFVSGSLAHEIRRYITNFDKIAASLLGGAERKDLSIFLMGSRIERALAVNFDPRPIWYGSKIRNVLTMRVPCSDSIDVYFTFNRPIDASDFCSADIDDARQVFSMISATSRRLYAEERLHLCDRIVNEVSEQITLGAVGRGEGRYVVSRISVARQASPAPACGSARQASQARSARPDDAVLCARPSGEGAGMDRLTKAELAIAALAAQGQSNKDIARLQRLSVYTVENHLKSVYRKLDLSGRGKLAPIFLSR